MAHLDDFQRLGATDIGASADGVAVSFASAKQANVAHELINDEFLPEVNGSNSRVPFLAQPQPDGAHVGWRDATEAIALLRGVASVNVVDHDATLQVRAFDSKAAARLDALLRDRILGLEVAIGVMPPSGSRGWGDGIG